MMTILPGSNRIGIPQNKFTIQPKKKTNQESCAIAVSSKQESVKMKDFYFVIIPTYKYSHKWML